MCAIIKSNIFFLFLFPSPLAHIFSFIHYLLNATPLDGRHIECSKKRNAMNFRRSQSKVWFGSQPSVPSVYDNFSSLPTYYHGTGKKSLQSISEQHEESLSPQHSNNSSNDADELKRSMLLWGNRKSPSFHSDKSQVRIELLEERKNFFQKSIKIQLEFTSTVLYASWRWSWNRSHFISLPGN